MDEISLMREIDRLQEQINALRTIQMGWQPVFLQTPLTSAAWSGGARSTTAKTPIDLSAEFGAPAGIKGVIIDVRIRDSDSTNTDCYIVLGPTNGALVGTVIDCYPLSDRWHRDQINVPCDSNGDIYFQIVASGVDTFDARLIIDGYWM